MCLRLHAGRKKNGAGTYLKIVSMPNRVDERVIVHNYENKIVRDFRDGKVTEEELDKCSTCDMCATVNDCPSDVSREQLRGKTGEEIVDTDIKNQMK